MGKSSANGYMHGRAVSTVFGLLGKDENSATACIGWTLVKSPAFASAFLSDVLGVERQVEELRVDMQRHGADRGFTDIEIRDAAFCHLIVEAKIGNSVAAAAQFSRYEPRMDAGAFRHVGLVSLSSMNRSVAEPALASNENGQRVVHRSWDDVVRMGAAARAATASRSERFWIDEMRKHLANYMQLQDLLSSIVRVVPLSFDAMVEGQPYRWVDAVEEDPPRYFQPIGGIGYPTVPPAYIGFRFNGKLRSVHFVERWQRAANPSAVDSRWLDQDKPHFVYTLGPAMLPAKEMRTGPGVWGPASHECAIDTLLSGRYATLGDAIAETKRRKKTMSLDASPDGGAAVPTNQ